MARLSRDFYDRDTVLAAQELLGKYLIRRLKDETIVCRITETEAYIGRCDKACHAYNYKKTERTSALFQPPGHAYVYFIYGMHHCLNFVTEPENEPAAVLIRGAEPVHGLDAMWQARYGEKPYTPQRMRALLNGPGKLCQALGTTKQENRLDLVTGETLFVCDSPEDVGEPPCPAPVREKMCSGPRIGVDYAEEARDFPWRFWLETEEVK